MNHVPEEKGGVLQGVPWNKGCTVFTVEKKAKYVSYSFEVPQPKLYSRMGQVGLYSDIDGDHGLSQEFTGAPRDRKGKWPWRWQVFQQGVMKTICVWIFSHSEDSCVLQQKA